MAVEITNKTHKVLKKALITQAVESTLAFKKRRGDVSVVFVGDAAIQRLNRQYRKKDYVTDILSFAEDTKSDFVGELIIDFKQIERQAKQYGHSISWELVFILIHGTLHLLGYEDETEKGRKTMEKLGYQLIKKIAV